MAKNEVAKTGGGDVATFDYGDMAHAGFEDTSIKDLSIPFVALLQSLSPEVEDQTIEGAKAGDLLNTVTKELIPQPLRVIPVYREESWVRWKPRHEGGGLRGRFEPGSEEVRKILAANGGSRIPPKGSDGKTIPFKDDDGNDVIETHYVYCLIIDEELGTTEGYCVMPFSSTKIKVYKDWMTALYTQKGRPPIFANRAQVSTTKQKSEGGSYFNFNIGPANGTWRDSLINPATQGDLLKEAQEFAQMIDDGLARPDFDSVNNGGGGEGQTGGGTPAGAVDEEEPF